MISARLRMIMLLVGVCGAGCSSPFDDAACTLDARSYPIEIARDVPFAFADATKLKVEACATREGQTPTCAIVAPVASGDSYTLGSSTDSVEGKLTKAANATIKLTLTAHVGEGAPGSTTIVRLRVLDDADKDVMPAAEGPVRWSGDDCHPTPDVSKI